IQLRWGGYGVKVRSAKSFAPGPVLTWSPGRLLYSAGWAAALAWKLMAGTGDGAPGDVSLPRLMAILTVPVMVTSLTPINVALPLALSAKRLLGSCALGGA